MLIKKHHFLSLFSTATLSLALVSSIAFASGTLGTGEDYYIDDYASRISNASSSGATLWAFTEGSGSDLSYVRVYSYFYGNGQLLDKDYDNDPSYAYISYTISNATRLTKAI